MSAAIDAAVYRRVAAAFAAMPVRQRTIFLAVRIEKASYAEIGARLGISIDAVERAFAQALVTLADAADA